MSKGPQASRDESDSSATAGTHSDTAAAPPPGPADHGRDGGMATRELAPEIAEPDD